MQNHNLQPLTSFEGTANDFVNAKIALGGVLLTQPTIAAFVRHGVFQVIGEGPKPARGRTPVLIRAVSNPVLTLTQEGD
jgi:hypothetical protein